MIVPDYWQLAKLFLEREDKVMARLMARYPEPLVRTGDSFHTLTRAIVGQQISIKVADRVWARLVGHVGGIAPATILGISEQELKGVGLSTSKVRYLRNIALYYEERKITDAYWEGRSFEEVREELLKIKGVGHWTVEMFAIFHLHEPDVFSTADIGLQKAVGRLYFDLEKLKKHDLDAFSERWRPFRTVAAWYLWRYLDPEPVCY